ncbi:MAG TPA: response regulator [Burkholderiales bacterium]|nr:response regulator [Burkholderiales bacterium]
MTRVLVVDDDADFRSMLKSALELAGYRVDVARDGKAALLAQRASPADILVTDLFMPEKDGFEAIEAFREQFPATRIVAVSGGARLMKTDYLAAAGMVGADAALQKPFEMEKLLELLETLAPAT